MMFAKLVFIIFFYPALTLFSLGMLNTSAHSILEGKVLKQLFFVTIQARRKWIG